MGIFKSFGEFATGAVQGATAALPGIQAANAQRQAQERQMRFQRELEGNRLDFTREQSILTESTTLPIRPKARLCWKARS